MTYTDGTNHEETPCAANGVMSVVIPSVVLKSKLYNRPS
jgi:hypothetical protein